MNAQNIIQDVVFQNNSWASGTIGSSRFIASSNSSLAAVIQQCPSGCSNTTALAFQGPNQAINVVNQTLDGWNLTTLNVNATPGSALAFQQFYDASPTFQQIYDPSSANELDVYYQHRNLSLIRSSWKPNVTQTSSMNTTFSISCQSRLTISCCTERLVASIRMDAD